MSALPNTVSTARPHGFEDRIAIYEQVEEDRFAFPDVKDSGFVRVVKFMISPGGRAGLCKIREPHAFDLAMVTSSPGEGPPLHMHTYPEVFTCLSGRYGIVWGNAGEHCIELGPMDTFSVPPNVMRQVMNISKDPSGTSIAIWDHHDPKDAVYHPRELVEGELAQGKRTGRKIGVGAMMPPQEMSKYVAPFAQLWDGPFLLPRERADLLGQTSVVISPRHMAGSARIAEPHGYHMLMSRARSGDRTDTYSRPYNEVLVGGEGRVRVRMGDRLETVVELGQKDTVSVPPFLPRSLEHVAGEPAVLLTLLDTPGKPW
jgi:uncharacterized RmlC-like cupin family protein